MNVRIDVIYNVEFDEIRCNLWIGEGYLLYVDEVEVCEATEKGTREPIDPETEILLGQL